LYRCWHLRDVAWAEKYDGSVGEIHRKWTPTAGQLLRLYPETAHAKLKEVAAKNPQAEVNCRVVMIEAEELHDELLKGQFMPHEWARLVIDVDNNQTMYHGGRWTRGLTIPRWSTVSGSQYAYSPATIAGLPDARLIQAITLTLLEAGEMAVRPPMVATQDAIRSDINLYPGGITWADVEYDERKGDVLQPLNQDTRSLPFGFEMQQDVRTMLSSAFYLNKLSLPAPGQGGMSPGEISARINEYIRDALPLFEPMEIEYNGGVCEETFELLFRAGVFGSPQDVPRELRGQNIRFQFQSPLHDALERKKGATFMEANGMLRGAMELDPTAQFVVDARTALREALDGIGVPARWMNTPEETEAAAGEMSQMAEIAGEAQVAQAGGAAIEQAGKAGQSVKELVSDAA
jgi:hypothetical protein